MGSIDPETYKKMMTGGAWTLHAFEVKEAKVRFVTDDVALVAYKAWVRRRGRWRCALHTESLLGDPYGRDRKS